MIIENLPILGICGYSGSGKTTLISEIIPKLIKKNIRVAVVKHSHKPIQIDTPGKDSDVIFGAGADVYFESKSEYFNRLHLDHEIDFKTRVLELAKHYDLVLVEGHKKFSFPKIWLLSDVEESKPEFSDNTLLTLRRDQPRGDISLKFIQEWLIEKSIKAPVYGCVLIGGKSSRMREPKHLIENNGKTWLEETVDKIKDYTDEIVVAGKGELPPGFTPLRLQDPPGINGPMAGIISAMRWNPWASWLIVACDMPKIQQQAISWLLDQRKPGTWSILPSLEDGNCEPLFAYYDFRIYSYLEELVNDGILKPSSLAEHYKTKLITPPSKYLKSWRNINCLKDLN